MSIASLAGLIAGGFGTPPNRSVICGGSEKIVGENARWFMSDKFYELKYAADDKYAGSITDKELLKIAGLKIPLNFNRTKFYDDKEDMPCKTEKKIDSDIHTKAILVLQNRLDEPITTTIKRLIETYDLGHPLFWAMSQFVRYLAFTHKKYRNNQRRIRITHDLTLLVEQIWHGNNYFKYVINTPNAPSNVHELIIKIFDSFEKARIPKGTWKEPILKTIEYPHLDSETKKNIQEKLKKEKNALHDKLSKENGKKKLSPINETKEYILTILNMEKILIDHLEKIEEYYIVHAENISALLTSMQKYFSSITKDTKEKNNST